MFWRKKPPPPSAPDARAYARPLVDLVVGKIKDARGVRVEDLISALAAIAAERCIEAAGNFLGEELRLIGPAVIDNEAGCRGILPNE